MSSQHRVGRRGDMRKADEVADRPTTCPKLSPPDSPLMGRRLVDMDLWELDQVFRGLIEYLYVEQETDVRH